MIFRPYQASTYWHIGVLLALLVGLLTLAACQTSPTPTAAVATSSPAEPADAPAPRVTLALPSPTAQPTPTAPAHLDFDRAALSGQTVEIWHPWKDTLASQMDALAAEFNRSNEWGIKVKVKALHTSGELFDAVNATLDGSPAGLPGVVVASADQLNAWHEQHNLVVNLSAYIGHPQVGLSSADLNAYQTAFWAQDQAADGSGTQLGLPGLRTAQVLFYNVTWAKELGFKTPPSSPAEFRAQACAAAVKNNAARDLEKYGTGGWLIDTGSLTTLSWLNAFGAHPVPEKEGQPYRFNSAEGVESVTYLRGLLDQGCAWLARSATPYEYFAQRKALFYTATLQDLQVQAGWQKKQKSADEWIVLPFPSAKSKPVIFAYGYSYALLENQKPANQAAGWLFIRWLSQPEHTARLTEALPSIPVSSAVAEQLSGRKSSFPMNQILPLADQAQAAPGSGSWRQVRRLLEDASWQIFHLPVESVPQIMPELDAAVQEMLSPAP